MSHSDDSLIFVGSYAPPDRSGIHAVTLDAAGRLRLVSAWAGIWNPSFLVAGPTGEHLYAVGETSLATEGTEGTVHAFRIDRGSEEPDLVPMGRRSTSGDSPCHLAIHPEGRWLTVANYGTGSVAVFPIESDGGLGEMAALVRHSGTGPRSDRQEGPHAHSSIFAPDGRFLIVADLGIDRLVVYGFDRVSGMLNAHGAIEASPGAGPRHLVFHPDGDHLFVVNELDSTVTVLGYDPIGGSLHPGQTLSSLPDEEPANTAADIHVSDTGRHVYVSNRGHDSLALFEFDPTDGLTATAIRPCGGNVPRNFLLTPDRRHVVVANQASDEVVLFPLVRGGSDLGEPLASLPVPKPSCVALAPTPAV